MRENQYPSKYKKILHDIPIQDLVGFLESYAVVARVLIETDDPVYALRSDRTIFPTGKFWATLTTGELQHALKRNRIKAVTDLVIYEQAFLFRSFVDRFYRLRREFINADDKIYQHFVKIFLNSLYGKFGQKGEVWEVIGPAPGEPDRIEDIIDAVTGRRSRLRYLLGEVSQTSPFCPNLP